MDKTMLRQMLPPLPAGFDFQQAQLRGGFALRRDVLIVPSENMRQNDGRTEVVDEKGEWHVAENVTVVAEGTQLDYCHLDFVVGLYGLRVEKRSVLAGPGVPDPLPLAQPVAELARVPADAYLAAFDFGKVQR